MYISLYCSSDYVLITVQRNDDTTLRIFTVLLYYCCEHTVATTTYDATRLCMYTDRGNFIHLSYKNNILIGRELFCNIFINSGNGKVSTF